MMPDAAANASKGHPAYRCEVCRAEHTWTVKRRGDVVVSWACPEHLSEVCMRLQRDHEVTRLVVTHSPKAREWGEISEILRKVEAPDARP